MSPIAAPSALNGTSNEPRGTVTSPSMGSTTVPFDATMRTSVPSLTPMPSRSSGWTCAAPGCASGASDGDCTVVTARS